MEKNELAGLCQASFWDFTLMLVLMLEGTIKKCHLVRGLNQWPVL
jgi:hypothetical protein